MVIEDLTTNLSAVHKTSPDRNQGPGYPARSRTDTAAKSAHVPNKRRQTREAGEAAQRQVSRPAAAGHALRPPSQVDWLLSSKTLHSLWGQGLGGQPTTSTAPCSPGPRAAQGWAPTGASLGKGGQGAGVLSPANPGLGELFNRPRLVTSPPAVRFPRCS